MHMKKNVEEIERERRGEHAVSEFIISHTYAYKHVERTLAMSMPMQRSAFFSVPATSHLTISSSFPRGIVSLQNSRLRFIRLRESITTLFAHALYLANLADGLLELLHPVVLLARLSMCEDE